MNSETVLIRQVHPNFVQKGRVTSQAFRPTPKDEGKLSTYDGDQIGVQAAWRHYTEDLGFESAGAYGLTVQEVVSLELTVTPDPEPFPEHVLIDFSKFERKQIEKKGKKLKAFAVGRGWLFQA